MITICTAIFVYFYCYYYCYHWVVYYHYQVELERTVHTRAHQLNAKGSYYIIQRKKTHKKKQFVIILHLHSYQSIHCPQLMGVRSCSLAMSIGPTRVQERGLTPQTGHRLTG